MIKSISDRVVKYIIYTREKENPHDDIERQKIFFNNLTSANNDYERAYNRYKCKREWYPYWYWLIANCTSLFIFPILWILFLIRGRKSTKHNSAISQSCDAIIMQPTILSYDDIIPQKIIYTNNRIKEVALPLIKEMFIDNTAAEIIKKCISIHPGSFYFNFIIMYQLARYCYWIHTYEPKAILRYAHEKQVEMPLVSMYCELLGKENIAFMHGTLQYKLTLAYLRTTKFFVWDEYYIKLLVDLGCPLEQFEIYTPGKLQGICKPRDNRDQYEYYATYYLCVESSDAINNIATAMNSLQNKGYRCKIRPHPRNSNVEMVYNMFKDFEIEDVSVIDIAQSLECSLYIIALESTVLLQAYYSGKEIVIDDYSSKDRYKLLKEKRDFMLNKPHILLSELLNNAEAINETN